jgi:hypothetical protein
VHVQSSLPGMDKYSESAAEVVPGVPSQRSLCGAMSTVLGSCSLGATYIAVPVQIERGAASEDWGYNGVEKREVRRQASKQSSLTDSNALLSHVLKRSGTLQLAALFPF